MLSIIGKILKKEKKRSQKRVELIVQDDFGNLHCFQVRPRAVFKIVEVDTGQRVKVLYKTELSEKYDAVQKETKRIGNNILMDVQLS